MTSVIRLLSHYYKFVDEDLSDPRTADWFLVGSLWVPFTIIAIYIYFVYFLGPAFMANRKPYNLQKLMVVYNIAQIFANAYVAYEAVRLGWFWKYKLICEPIDYSNEPDSIQMAARVWFFYLVKIADLFDTVFFILRKKQNQITFLHVYHHAGMIIVTWIGVRYLPGGHGTFVGLINSYVHVVMYTHYLLTSLKMGKPWWKKYITQIQLVQFYMVTLHSTIGLMIKECNFPKWTLAIFLPQNFFMMVLFTDFYYRTYLKKKPEVANQNGMPNTTESKQENVELPNGKSKTY